MLNLASIGSCSRTRRASSPSPTRAEVARPVRLRTAFGFLLVASAVLIVGLPTVYYPLCTDQSVFCYVGNLWLHGGLPYRDAWDIKPPGTYAVYAAAVALFGYVPAACRWADVLSMLLGCLLLAWFGLLRRNLRTGVLAGVLCTFTYFASYAFSNTAQTESFTIVPTMAMLLLAYAGARRNSLLCWTLSGISLGLELTLKPNLLLLSPLILPFLLENRPTAVRSAAAYFVGIGLPLLVLVLYFAHRGGLQYLTGLSAAIEAYSGHRGTDAGQSVWQAYRFARNYPLVGVELVLAWFVFASRAFKPDRGRIGFEWMYLLFAYLTTVVQGRYHDYHFLPVLPPASLLAACALDTLFVWSERLGGEPRRVLALGATCLVAMLPLVWDARDIGLGANIATGKLSEDAFWDMTIAQFDQGRILYYWAADDRQIRDAVKARSRPGDLLMCYYTNNSYNTICGLASPSSLFFQSGAWPKRFRTALSQRIMADCRARPPVFLITQDNWIVPGIDIRPLYANQKKMRLAGMSSAADLAADFGRDPWPEEIKFIGLDYRKIARVHSFAVFERADRYLTDEVQTQPRKVAGLSKK